jgi:hypothetical protein
MVSSKVPVPVDHQDYYNITFKITDIAPGTKVSLNMSFRRLKPSMVKPVLILAQRITCVPKAKSAQ